jgi:phosphate transport system substrate-binding protein
MWTRSLVLGLGVVAASAALLFAPTATAQVKVDDKLPNYKATSGVSGTIKSVGSDTMNNLMTLWGEGFQKLYPNVEIEIEGKGSATAPPALIEGTSTFGPMSREMKKDEIAAFQKQRGYKPTALPTSLDMLAVYVHKDNPIAKKGLTFQQVDAIFSANRKGGYATDIKTWGDVGLEGKYAKEPIRLYGRNSVSGTYLYFKEHVLKGGDYKDTVKEQPGSSTVVQSVSKDEFGIGYSGIGYKTDGVAAVSLASKPGAKVVPPTPENVTTYPLARYLYIYVNYKPESDLDPLRAEFIKYVFSKQGQMVVVKDGYLPINAARASKALKSVGLAK